LIVVPRPLFAAALVMRRRYLIMVLMPMPAAARSYSIAVPRPTPAAPLVVHRRYLIAAPDRLGRPRKAIVWGRQPSPAQRFVARGSEPSARQAERTGKRECVGKSPHLPSASLPAVASRLQEKPSAAESGGVGAA
jgi:hypothetical protein